MTHLSLPSHVLLPKPDVGPAVFNAASRHNNKTKCGAGGSPTWATSSLRIRSNTIQQKFTLNYQSSHA